MASMWRIALALLVVASSVGDASADGYPSRPVHLVVPAGAGGASDVIARMLAPGLSTQLGQPFIVENRVTSGGIIATQQVADAPPDGETLRSEEHTSEL